MILTNLPQHDYWVFGVVVALVATQVTFGFMLKKRREAFLKYHQSLGVLIFFIVLFDILLTPLASFVALIVLLAVIAQIMIGYLISRGRKNLVRYHRPLGFALIFLAVINLILIIL